MFGLGKKRTQPLGSARAAARWLATLPGNDPFAVQRAVLAELRTLEERTARRTPPKLEAVFAVDAHMTGVVRTLTAQYVEHAARSPKIENQLWQAQFDLTQGFQACYAAFARDIPHHGRQNKWSGVLPALIARQIIHLQRDAKFRLFRSEPWISIKWVELHAAFARACGQQIDRQPLLLDPSRGPTTIEREYLVALMLPLVDPGNLTPAQVEWVASQLEAWCRPLKLTMQPAAATAFYVDLAGSAGLRRRSLGPLGGQVLFVDTGPLHALLLQNRATLEQPAGKEPAAGSARRQRELPDLFVRLASRVDPDFRPLPRRGERSPASGAVDAIVGFNGISGFLHEGGLAPTAAYTAGRSFGNTLDLAVFGRTRMEPDNQAEYARRRLAAYAAPGGPWEMKDISASGFRLHAPMSVATEITLSMLVAIRRRGRGDWMLGMVRRMRRLSANSAEIGLQLIADSLVGADLVLQREVRDADYSVDGKQTALAGHRFRGLFLSFSPRSGEPAVQTLIVPPAEYRSARRYAWQTADGARMIRFGRVLEQHTDWIWAVIDPVGPGAAAATAAAER